MKSTPLILVCCIVFCLFAQIGSSQTTKIDSLTALLPKVEGEELVSVYLQLSGEYIYIAPAKVISYSQQALAATEDPANEASAKLFIGIGYLYSGDFAHAREFIDQGYEQAKSLEDPKLILTGLTSVGAYHMNLGEYTEALKYYREGLAKAMESGYDDRAASCRLNIGSILTTLGDRIRGLRYLLGALDYYEKKDDPKIESRVLNNIALNYHYWKDYDKALNYYQKTLVVNQKIQDAMGQVIVLNNIGEVYKDKGDLDQAIVYYKRVVDTVDSLKVGDFYKAYGWIGLAEAYMIKGEYRQSDHYVGLALSEFEEVKMQEGIAMSYFILSQISYNLGYYSQALRQVEQTLELAKTNGIIDLEEKAYKSKSNILAQMGNYREAFENQKQYLLISDTLFSQERTRNFNEIRDEIETTQQQNEIELLQKDNQIKDLLIRKQKSRTLVLAFGVIGLLVGFVITLSYIRSRKKTNDMLTEKNRQISRQHIELINANETKDKFLSIIGHDLRNPIGAFKDVVGQLADFPEMFTEDMRQQIVGELRDEAESTYFLLENLLSWAKSQKDNISFKPERLDLPTVIQHNLQLNYRAAERKKLRIAVDADGDFVASADHNMVNLVLRNLLSNATKFTSPGGQVQVTVQAEGKYLRVSVRDTGVGIAQKDLPRLFDSNDHLTTYGTNHEKGSGLGLLLCKEFVEANGGTITVKSTVGKGSTFSFTLKRYTEAG